MRLAVKDLFDTAGLVTTYGSILFAEHVPAETRGGRAPARGGRLRRRRQDEPARVRVRDDLREPALRHRPEPARARAGSRAARAAARPRRSPPGSPTPRSAPTRAARSGSRPPAAASSASSRPTGSSRSTAASRSRRASTTPGRWPATSTAARAMLEALAPGLRADRGRARRRSRSASPGSSSPTRSSGRGSRRRPRASRAGARSTCRSPQGIWPAFMREVADVHRELFAEHARLVRRERRREDRALPGRDRRRLRARGRARASATASASLEAAAGVDLLLDPDARVRRSAAPARTSSRCATRSRSSRSRSTRRAGRRSRSRAAPPRTACPPRCSSPPRPAPTRSCSPPARRSSALCPSTESLDRVTSEALRSAETSRTMARVRCGVVLLVALVVCGSAQARARRSPERAARLHAARRRAGRPHLRAHALVRLEPGQGRAQRTSSSSRPAGASTTTRSSGRRTA